MVRFLLYIIFSAGLLGNSSDSLKLVNYVRSTLKQGAKINPQDLGAKGYVFVDSARDVDDLIKVLISRKEETSLKKIIVDGMMDFRSKDSLDTMSKFAKVDRNFNEFSFSLFLFHGVIPENDLLWSNLIKSRDPKVAEFAITELGGSLVNSPKVADALIQRLKNTQDSKSLKTACIRKFTEVPTNKAASSIAWLLGNATYKDVALTTLTQTTGQTFGFDISKWQKWIRENRQFVPMVTPAKEYPGRELAKARKELLDQYPDRYAENNRTSVKQEDIVLPYPQPGHQGLRKERSLYGIDIEGQNILFFLDCSGSMRGERYNLLKGEMIYMALTMGDSYSIGVVFFPFGKEHSVLEVSKNNRAFQSKLKRFLSRKKVGGPSPLLGAMQHAYNELIDTSYHSVDSIYIISDGYIGNPEARAGIYDLNAEKRLPIHTVCIRGNTEFLNGVASDNGGKSYLVR